MLCLKYYFLKYLAELAKKLKPKFSSIWIQIKLRLERA